MTEEDDSGVGVTADGLVVVRSSTIAARFGVDDPFAPWFVTDAGRRLHAAALEVDAQYERLNLARFRRTSEILRAASTDVGQVVLLGAGFDCRALWLEGLREGHVPVYEVDQADKLRQKARMLAAHGVTVPAWDHHLATDLRAGDLLPALAAHGHDPTLPTLVLAEGISFFLPTATVASLLRPESLGLAPGSRLVFDCWAEARVTTLNQRTRARLGRALFHPFPWRVEPTAIEQALGELGYRHVSVTSLERLANEYAGEAVTDEFPDSWQIVEARVPESAP